jgi:hypothetical protein
VELVEEEMHRVLQFLRWHAEWWRSQVGLRDTLQSDAALREGHLAYARKQAAYMEGLAAQFEAAWNDVPGYLRDARQAYTAIRSDDEEETGGETDGIGLAEDSGWLTD